MPKKKITTIKELRASQKLSQAAFAKTIGISTASVGAYETGRINPSEKVLEKIKEVYGVDLSHKPVKASKSVDSLSDTPAVEEKPKRARKTKQERLESDAAAAEKPKAKPTRKVKENHSEPGKTEIFIQSPMGGIITPDEIIAKVGDVDKVYIRVDENKAYWVKGEETGDVDIW